METNWRLPADIRMVDIGERNLAVQLEPESRQSTAAPHPLNGNSGPIDDIIISPVDPFAAFRHQTILQELSLYCPHLFGPTPSVPCAVGCTSEPGGPGNPRALESRQRG